MVRDIPGRLPELLWFHMGTKGLEVGGEIYGIFVDLEHVGKEEKSLSLFFFRKPSESDVETDFSRIDILHYCTLKQRGGKSVLKKMVVPPNHGTKDTVVAPSRDHLAKTKKGMLRPLWDVGRWV